MIDKKEMREEILRAYRKDYAPHLNYQFHIEVFLDKFERTCASREERDEMLKNVVSVCEELAAEGLVT